MVWCCQATSHHLDQWLPCLTNVDPDLCYHMASQGHSENLFLIISLTQSIGGWSIDTGFPSVCPSVCPSVDGLFLEHKFCYFLWNFSFKCYMLIHFATVSNSDMGPEYPYWSLIYSFLLNLVHSLHVWGVPCKVLAIVSPLCPILCYYNYCTVCSTA